jgi:predicted PurR-regulated permease PerM/methylmalonyl-CoA mutase cobalamin-binding subunit
MSTERPSDAVPAPPPTATPAGDAADAAVVPDAPRFFFGAASAALVIAALHYGQEVLMPLALAALLAFVLDPLVTRLRRIGVPLLLAVTLVVSLTLALVGALAALAAQQITTLSRELPTYQSTIQKKLRELRPAPGDSGVVRGASRLVAVIEGEINAARAAIEPGSPAATRAPARVLVEPAPPSPLRALGDMVGPLLLPLASAGLVIVLLAYMLAQRREISDRLIRLAGGDLHRMAEALNEAARRVSRYLAAQVLVNIGYGIPLALGLWLIGVPGALLWGALAAVLRFVPYLGPLVAAVFPLLLAFAVDPGWSMVLWTAALIVLLELVVNNIVEPLAYGGSTGVSPVAVLLSAGFWLLVWGPSGLVLATPLTVCGVVLGRHLGALRFLDVLLGTDPAFDPPTQLYRRLIAGDREEAIAQAADEAERSGLRSFYNDTGVPMLGLAAGWSARRASAHQRHRVLSGAARLLDELRDDHAGAESAAPRVLCVGARSEFDSLSAEMLAHALAHEGVAVKSLPALAMGAERIGALALQGVSTLVLCSFHPQPQAHARFVCKRVRRRAPGLRIVLAAWGAPAALDDAAALEAIGVDALALTLIEALSRAAPADAVSDAADPSPAPEAPPLAGPPAPPRERLARAAQRAAEVFGVTAASVLWRDAQGVWLHASAGRNPAPPGTALSPQALLSEATPWSVVLARGSPLAVPDITRSPEWASAPQGPFEACVAFAGVPLLDQAAEVSGVLALHDLSPRDFSDDDLALLTRIGQTLVDELAAALRAQAPAPPPLAPLAPVVLGAAAPT